MSDRIVVRSSSVEAAKALARRNSARGVATDPWTLRLAGAKYVNGDNGETNGSTPAA